MIVYLCVRTSSIVSSCFVDFIFLSVPVDQKQYNVGDEKTV